jgi:hypothetical protein
MYDGMVYFKKKTSSWMTLYLAMYDGIGYGRVFNEISTCTDDNIQ